MKKNLISRSLFAVALGLIGVAAGVNFSNELSLEDLRAEGQTVACKSASNSDCISTSTGTIYFAYENV